MHHKLWIIVPVIMTGLWACSGAGTKASDQQSAAQAPKPIVKSSLDSNATFQLVHVLDHYYALKNALVATDSGKVSSTAGLLVEAVHTFSATLAADSVSGNSLKIYLDTMINEGNAIAGITDKNCERQRVFFSPLSRSFVAILKRVAIKNAGIYVQHCPMALNEVGADWLSDEEDIKNPYFGKKMLECGEVTDSLK